MSLFAGVAAGALGECVTYMTLQISQSVQALPLPEGLGAIQLPSYTAHSGFQSLKEPGPSIQFCKPVGVPTLCRCGEVSEDPGKCTQHVEWGN